MGHPGEYKTQEIVSRNYWWPRMSQFIKAYVSGCATCQETKNITHPTRIPLQPTKVPERPYQFITMDFVVKLPISNGYDLILMVTCQLSKAITLIACNETIDAAGTADLLIKHIFCIYGVAEKAISDRGPQFASQVMKAVLQALGVKSALSTAYHPQTDGATERANQEAEQFLRAYVNRIQDNWDTLLPFAALTHNTHVHSATKKTPMEVIFGQTPRWPHHVQLDDKIPKAQDRINNIEHARQEAHSAILLAQKSMKDQHDRYGDKGPDWEVGDKVWLDKKNLKTYYPSAKLAPKRLGPYKILERIGTTSYRLDLPDDWKIHDVFHGSLLTAYVETEEHGPNYIRPDAELVEDEEEYEVEEVFNVWHNKRKRRWEYYVSWVGWPESENSWQPMGNLKNAMELVKDFHQRRPKKPKPRNLAINLLQLNPNQQRELLQTLEKIWSKRIRLKSK
jgi:hypothetical protein